MYQTFFIQIIEKVISIGILGHILDNSIVDSFQSAYRAGHSCETALLRVYNDIVTTIGKGSFLVLLDLSTAFDMIDHDNLFYRLEKYVGIGDSALRLIQSYFCDLTQRVQIDGIMSDFASLLCGVPQGSVLGPMKFCLYLLPLGAILIHHNIGYHIYADDCRAGHSCDTALLRVYNDIVTTIGKGSFLVLEKYVGIFHLSVRILFESLTKCIFEYG